MEKEAEMESAPVSTPVRNENGTTNAPTNASGHAQELDRNFGLWSICGLAITSDNVWISLGGSIIVAINNGGPPGVIYEFIAATGFYCFIAASIAELASSVPSAGGVYHWATITGGRHGRIIGFFAGWLNFLAWIFALAATVQIVAAMLTSMYALFHPDFTVARWHVFVTYVILLGISFVLLLFANKILPFVEALGGSLVLLGCFVSIIICAAMADHSSTDFVWREWQNNSGYESNGFVFLLGMLNGAYAIGGVDVISHLAEEVPRPSVNLPKGILAEFVIGFVTGVVYLVAIFYSISDFDKVVAASATYLFPLTEIYLQASGSRGGAFGLLLLGFFPYFISIIGCYLTASRVFWGLARDNATPFNQVFGRVNYKTHNPANSIVFCAAFCIILGCIYLGSDTAFSAFVGSFVVLSSQSYLLAILPHLLSGRSNVKPGWFWMRGPVGYIVNSVACLYIIVFTVIFCFPATPSVTAETMNWTCLMTGGLVIAVCPIWFWKRGEYRGPPILSEIEITAKDAL